MMPDLIKWFLICMLAGSICLAILEVIRPHPNDEEDE